MNNYYVTKLRLNFPIDLYVLLYFINYKAQGMGGFAMAIVIVRLCF